VVSLEKGLRVKRERSVRIWEKNEMKRPVAVAVVVVDVIVEVVAGAAAAEEEECWSRISR
jgi:hypothetical protein